LRRQRRRGLLFRGPVCHVLLFHRGSAQRTRTAIPLSRLCYWSKAFVVAIIDDASVLLLTVSRCVQIVAVKFPQFQSSTPLVAPSNLSPRDKMDQMDKTDKTDKMDISPDLNSIFTQIRDKLDAHYDRRERLIKISRDITALSKKMIFSLQRIQGQVDSLPSGIQKQIDQQEGEIRKLLKKAEQDIQGANAHRSPSPSSLHFGSSLLLDIIDRFRRGYRSMYVLFCSLCGMEVIVD
jgi:hypothetical protein